QVGDTRGSSYRRLVYKRYASQAAVIGIVLYNAPVGAAAWGHVAAATDWRAAAERGGNSVLAENPKLLVLVGGIDHEADGSGTLWGGAPGFVGNSPVRLSVADRLGFSPHYYPSPIFGHALFSASN
ncbi:cellulase family glycosylhydrolase, partial [Clavibacter michiganensis]|uniref:cellulase family glycosylhydrolase n=1 Tax=Clavibacter michiganensis TaxID=28447 RepID=UPI0029315AD3